HPDHGAGRGHLRYPAGADRRAAGGEGPCPRAGRRGRGCGGGRQWHRHPHHDRHHRGRPAAHRAGGCASDGEPVVGELDHPHARHRNGSAGRRGRPAGAPHRLLDPRTGRAWPRGSRGALPHGPLHPGHASRRASLARARRPQHCAVSRQSRSSSAEREAPDPRHDRGRPRMSATRRVHHVPRHRRHGTPSSRSKLLQASVVMAAGSMISRLLGFVRNFLFGAILGGSMSAAANAFSAANTLPNTIWLLVGGGTLNAILVPAIVRAVKRPDRGSDYVSRLMTLVAAVSLGITLVCLLAVPLLLTLTSGVLGPATYALAVQMGYWMMPQIFFSALYVMCGQLLNAHDSFGPYQWAPVVNNLVGILGAALFLGLWGAVGDPSVWSLDMIIAIALINVGGSAAQVLFLFWYVKKLDLRLRPKWGLRGLGLGKLSR